MRRVYNYRRSYTYRPMPFYYSKPNGYPYVSNAYSPYTTPYPTPYPKPTPFISPPQPGIQSIMNSFKKPDGNFDFNKMMDTAGQLMSTMNQMSSLFKGVSQFFKT